MNRRPAVWILKERTVLTDSFEPVLWGLEEEGIPFEVHEAGDVPVIELGKQAANGSPLNVGIGISVHGELILHHRDLPMETPLFSLIAEHRQSVRLRHLGMNAARLVKGQALVFDNGETTPSSDGIYSTNTQDRSKELIDSILNEILRSYTK
jgi:hypothetical protein